MNTKVNTSGFDLDKALADDPNQLPQSAVQAALQANAAEDADRAKREAQRRLREADSNLHCAVGNLREVRQREKQHTKYVKLMALARAQYVATGNWSQYSKDSGAAYSTAFQE